MITPTNTSMNVFEPPRPGPLALRASLRPASARPSQRPMNILPVLSRVIAPTSDVSEDSRFAPVDNSQSVADGGYTPWQQQQQQQLLRDQAQTARPVRPSTAPRGARMDTTIKLTLAEPRKLSDSEMQRLPPASSLKSMASASLSETGPLPRFIAVPSTMAKQKQVTEDTRIHIRPKTATTRPLSQTQTLPATKSNQSLPIAPLLTTQTTSALPSAQSISVQDTLQRANIGASVNLSHASGKDVMNTPSHSAGTLTAGGNQSRDPPNSNSAAVDPRALGPAPPGLPTDLVLESDSRGVPLQGDANAAMKIWWLEQNLRVMNSKAASQEKVAHKTAEKVRRLSQFVEEREELEKENEHLRVALADYHAARETDISKIREELKKEYYLQRKQVFERNENLTHEHFVLREQIDGLRKLLEERENLVKTLREDTAHATLRAETLQSELEHAHDQSKEWQNACSREQKNALESFQALSRSEADAKTQRRARDVAAASLEEAKVTAASLNATMKALKLNLETSERQNRDLKLNLERSVARAQRAESSFSAKEAESEALQRTQSHLLDAKETLEMQLEQQRLDIDRLRLKTIDHDKLVEDHKLKQGELEGRMSAMQDLLRAKEKQSGEYVAKIEDLVEARSKLEGELIASNKMYGALTTEMSSSKERIGKLESENNAQKARIMQLDEETHSLRGKGETLTARTSQLELSLREAEVSRATMAVTERELETRIRELVGGKALLEANMQAQSLELRGLTKQYITLQSDFSAARSQLSAKTESLSSAKFERERAESLLHAQSASQSARIKELSERLADLQQELTRVRVERDSDKSNADKEIKALKRQLVRRAANLVPSASLSAVKAEPSVSSDHLIGLGQSANISSDIAVAAEGESAQQAPNAPPSPTPSGPLQPEVVLAANLPSNAAIQSSIVEPNAAHRRTYSASSRQST